MGNLSIMEPERWARLRLHVESATALPNSDRLAYLQREIADPELLAEVLNLLGYEQNASEILAIDGLRDQVFEAVNERSLAGTLLGNYRLLHEIGRGGMGAVYLAERADGVYEHKVAIKVLQESLFTQGLVERFQQERQILARLSHPGVARLLDGGVTLDGRPYLVLEYVDGISIDRFCVEQKLDTTACLLLFLEVAQILQSAHQQLILHLDLKPANILITAQGQPRLLDFGIARVLAESGGATQQAEETMRLLTPRYASPEQLRGEALGVASDVFSLATLLYRLLTGVLPYPVEGVSPLEAARMITSVDPVLPSKTTALAGPHNFKNDLDAILMQALRKEPQHRYPTVAAFAEDVRRHLEQRPVLAHADVFRYRTGKFLRRNGGIVTAAAVAVLLLTLTTSLAVRSAIKAERSRKIAESRLKDVQDIAHSYVFDLETMLKDIPGTLHVRQFVLLKAKKYLDAMYQERADDEALDHDVVEGYTEIGRVQATPAQASMSDPDAALVSKAKALAIEQTIFSKHPENLVERRHVVRMLYQNALGYNFSGDLAHETALLQQAWAIGQPLIVPGTKTWRPLFLAVIAWSIAVDLCGNGDEWNFADPLAAVPWLDRAQALVEQYRSATPVAEWDDLARQTEERIAVSRNVVLMHTGREAEAIIGFQKLLAQTKTEAHGTDTMQTSLRGYLTGLLLESGDLRGAKKAAIPPSGADVHEKNMDHQLKRQQAEDLILQGRFNLAEGNRSAGTAKIKVGIAALEAARLELPQNAQISSSLAWILFAIGEEKELKADMRQSSYERARALAQAFGASHPEALSTSMLIGRCDLGLARLENLAHMNVPSRELAIAAETEFSKVLAMHPVQPEASLMLAQARAIKENQSPARVSRRVVRF